MRLDEHVRWIAFDAVGTLIFADPPVSVAYFRVARKYGSRLTPDDVRARFRVSYARHAAAPDGPADVLGDSATSESLPEAGAAERAGIPAGEAAERRFWRRVVADVLPDVRDADACFDELFAWFADPRSWSCFADVEETCVGLRRSGRRLALASNFDARLQRVCDGHPELAAIERRVISSEVGSRKPHEAFYRALLRACECRPDELLMVGDDPVLDVAAARRLGLQAVCIDRGADPQPGALRALTELLE